MNIRANLVAASLVVVIGTAASILPASSAAAAGSYPTLADANIREQPTTASTVMYTVPKGTQLAIDCFVWGESVRGVTLWNHLATGGYISDTLLLTGSDGPVVPRCIEQLPLLPGAPKWSFSRQAAADWATAHVNDDPRFPEDCTWFVSQALWAGGLPKSASWSDTRFGLPKPTLDAVNADELKNYLVNEAKLATITELSWRENDVPQAQLGDLVVYDWGKIDKRGNWTQGTDGIIDHMMIITGFSGAYPLVSGHSLPTLNQGWTWSNASNNWYESAVPGARAYLIHFSQ